MAWHGMNREGIGIGKQDGGCRTAHDVVDVCVVPRCGPVSVLLYGQALEHPVRPGGGRAR